MDSSIVYQGYGRELGEDFIRQINVPAEGSGPRRHLPLRHRRRSGALSRATRGGHADRIEAEGAAFQRRLRDAYAALREKEPERIRVLDGSGSIEEVFARTKQPSLSCLNTEE